MASRGLDPLTSLDDPSRGQYRPGSSRVVDTRLALSPEIIDRLLYCASRAPSPHNAQGWRIEWDGDGFAVRLERDRQVLHELDPESREGEVACGAAIANLERAATALGFTATTTWRPDGDDGDLLATVGFDEGTPADESLLGPIGTRAVNRSHYRPEPVPPAVLEALASIARADGLTLHVVTDTASIGAVAQLAARAGRLKMLHAETARELYRLMRFSGRDAAAARDGLDLALFDLPPGGARASACLLHPSLLATVPWLARALTKQADEDPLRSAPAVCVLAGPADGRNVFLEGGRAFQQIGLLAGEHGLALQPHSAAIEVALGLPRSLDPQLPATEVPAIDAALRRAFGIADTERPIVLFRLGRPTHEPRRRSLRRNPRSHRRIAPDGRYRELTRRNGPAISPEDQSALAHLRVLFAGCGSIGGAPVEVLARLGLCSFVLAEPGTYELNNLNRQAALITDIGRNKADVLADRVRAINADAEVLVERSGVTAGNVDWLVGTTDVIIDGVDVTEASGIAAKRLLHEEAWRQRRLVIAGLDIGGTQLVLVFDYRDPRTRCFDGRLDNVGEQITAVDFLARLILPLDMPMEMIGYAEAMIRGGSGSPPQLAPTATLFGVLAAWAVFDFASGRSLKRRVKIDVPTEWMPAGRRIRSQFVRVFRLVRLKWLLETKRARRAI